MSRESSGDDHFDLESQSHLLVKDGGDNSTASTSGPSHRWRSIIIILHVRQAFISSARNKSLAVDGIAVVPPPPSIATSNTGGDGDGLNVELAIIPTSPEVSLDVQSDGADESNKCNKELQNAEITRIVKAKDLNSLHEFGGVQGFAEALDTDLENGLANDEDDLCCRRLTCPQSETKAPQEGFFHILWNVCNKYLIFLLLLCSVLSIVFGILEEGLHTGWYEGAFVICAIIVLVSVPMIREYWYSWYQPRRKKLSKTREIAVHVFRDGLFISGESLKLDDELESTIDDQNPFMFHGAKVINGKGKMLVVSIGKDTVWGEMMSNVINASNPLQVQLDQLNNCIQIIGVLITIIILVVLFLHFEFSKGSAASVIPDLKAKPAAIKEFIDAIYKIVKKPKGKTDLLTSSLTMILVGIAEGLPLMVTLALYYWNKKALLGKATTQDFLACITMGSVTTICTDKTCGLNLHQREVDMLYVSGQFFNNESAIAPKVIEALCKGIATPILGLERPLSSMEDSLLYWASLKLGPKLDILKQECKIVEVKELNFDEEGCGVLMRKDGESVNSSYWKGSASTILAMCSSYYSSEGAMNVIDEQQRVFFEQVIADMQGKHLKTIAFGYKQTDRATLEETGLILLGLLGLKNSFRKSMEDCIGAGVNIKLVSGCDASELESIALECGLNIPNSDSVVLGENFRNSTHKGRMEMVDQICVMASSLPSDKLLLVKCLKEKGHIVAMVGARTDETPAIKEANVGITMGSGSTEMARESSNIIIWDGDFNSLFTIMKCGRCAYENVQKFIQLEFTVTIAWVLINIITTICFGDVPITTIQYFYVCFIVAVPGGLALLMDPPTKTLMKKSPIRSIDSPMTRTMWRNIVLQALYQAAILVTFRFKGQAVLDTTQKVSNAMIFNSFVLCQVFNWFNARELERKNVFKGIHRNCWFWIAMVGTIVLLALYTKIANIFAGSARLNPEQWAFCFLIGAVSWVIDWAVKSTSNFIADRFHRS
ncbi:putative calcium-transporting ATPase 13, plasma membrane-type [Camellia sinensis]|uniref:putative calcium-transporting ATPase 13, plasma membrane-type n=1 Tax=Camellia sinensis TaxID=4442 RepID=UPI001036229B|nr:putative calcium-transporting ATPase 13, plasma membrane-type [Camellia sinensis]